MIMLWEAMHMYKCDVIHEIYFMIAEMWKSTQRNTYTQNSKIKQTSPTIS